MNNLLVMEAANLFAGDADPNASNHLSITELKLPTLEEAFTDHNPGGAPIGIEVLTHMNKLESTFNLAGFTPQVATLIGRWSADTQHFTSYALVRDRMSGQAIQGKAIVWGRLGRVNPTNFRRGDLFQHEYSIKGITHYELYIGDNQVYFWDFFTSQRIIGGIDTNADYNLSLNIPAFQPGVTEASGVVTAPVTQAAA